MGQAKKRGSFEVRKEQSIERERLAGEAAYLAMLEAEAKMPPKEKKQRRAAATTLSLIAPFMYELAPQPKRNLR